MVKKKGIVWNYFTKKIYGAQVTAFCNFCDQSYIQNATRMEKHIVRCPKCPDDVKHAFLKAVRTKKANSVMALRLASNWSLPTVTKQNNTRQNFTEVNLPEWKYNEDDAPVNDGTRNANEVEDSKDWNKNLSVQDEQNEYVIPHVNWEPNNDDEGSSNDIVEQNTEEQIEEEPEVTYTRRVRSNRRSLQPPVRTTYNSAVQNKIQHEQYLEKRALRRVAEIELQHKTLEYEKLKWEFENQKTQSEARWIHECRMMQLKELHQQQLTGQIHSKPTTEKQLT
ncbi:uncharacterized protein LOC106642116 [Copidosoma floridanum]|uniref:uncharacterized protein LOC106642116 n=1 Tax=Copidosoma floridanum TaxID=29053 RepID=UPI0006C9C780|nr:uncharacterized protein LOC106642116 [Copidosoma floridanum]